MSDIWVDVEVRRYDDNYSRLSVEQFAERLVEAASGLSDAYVDAHEFYDGFQIVVRGRRARTPDEMKDLERQERIRWVSAKKVYEDGLGKYGGTS